MMMLHHPPEWREATVLTTLPEHYRRTGVRSAWADANCGGEPIDSFLEGPVFDRAGNLYVCDIPFGRVFCIDPQGGWKLVAEYDGEPNGMKFVAPHELLIADYRNGLVKLDIRSGQTTPWLARRNSESFKGVNDLIFDRQGNLYFTDQGQSGLHDPSGRLYRLRPDGTLDLLLANVPSPNGVALSPDERVLYIAVTRGNAIWRAPLMADGSVAKVGQFFTSYGPSGPDGLAADEAGNLVIANPGLGYVYLLNPRAEPLIVWRSPAGSSTTNIAYGGPKRKTLYCTESTSGSILCMDAPHPGLALPHGRRITT